MASDGRQTPWWELKHSHFFLAGPEDDLLHPAANALVEGDTVSETQYFGFNVPEYRIYGIGYLWHHPHLHVVMGGMWVIQGSIRHSFQSPISDFVTYESDRCLANDLHDVRLANGYRTTVVEALTRHRVEYADAARGNRVQLEYTAVMPALLTKGGLHLEQAMRVTGTVTLLGTEYPVDCFNVRDRSWGAVRPETHRPFPPVPWMHCVFGDDLAFACTAFDTPDGEPEWEGTLTRPVPDSLVSGWVWRDGDIVPITAVQTKHTERDMNSLHATSARMTLVDAKDRTYDLTADILAAGNWRTWQNFDAAYCLARWNLDGRTSHGDFQEVMGADYVRKFMRT